MRVRCVYNSAIHLDACYLNSGWLKSSTIDLSVGKHYSVYGMRLLGGGLNYLLVDDTGYVGWKPSTLFNVVDRILPSSWVFSGGANMHPKEDNARWGYDLLCSSVQHHDGLISCEAADIALFELQRERMDGECRQRHLLNLIESHSSAFDEKAMNDLKELAFWNEVELALETLTAGLRTKGISLPAEVLEWFE